MSPFRSWLRILGRPALALALGVGSFAVATAPPAEAVLNEISSHYVADPGFNRFGSTYYVYGTGGKDSGTLPVLSGTSTTGGFTQVGNAFRSVPKNLSLFWAPHVIQRGSTYFMFFAAKPTGAKHCLYYAVSSRPDGDFHRTRKLICGPNANWESIDPSTYTTVENNTYLVWRDGWVKSFPRGDYAIKARRLAFSGSTVRFTSSTTTLASVTDTTVMEAPDVIRHDGKLYLFVSRGRYDTNGYHTDVWSGATIRSAFTPPKRHLMTTKGGYGYGPGGAEVLGKPAGKVYIAYHVWEHSKPNGGPTTMNRVTRIATVTWKNGQPTVS